MNFTASRRKVERATEHIRDLNQMLDAFAKSDFYSISVKEHKGSNHVFVDVDRSGLDRTRAALIIGDALHNLRSALDMLYYQAFDGTTGVTDHRTRFPIRNEWEELIAAIDGGLEKKGLTNHPSAIKIRNAILGVVKPYQGGNWTLWALHDMNIRDKHQLLVPVFDVMRFTDIRLQNERGEIFLADNQPYMMDESSRFKVEEEGCLTVKDKGHAAIAIVFSVGVPYQSNSVIQSLHEMSEAVTRTIDAFDDLGLRSFFE